MLGLDVANFVYPSPGYVYPSSSCNATWRQMLATADVDNMSYPPNDPSSAAAMNVAALICRFSDDKRISNTAWQAYAYLSSYGYRPSAGFALFALAIFSISCLGHVYQVLHTRRWSMVTVIIGIILEIYGWWLRYLASFDLRYYYVEQLAVLTLAPTFFTWTIFILFSMVASSVNTERLFGVRPQHTLWIWIGLDVTMLGLQAVGGGLAGTYDGDPNRLQSGLMIMLSGICLQLAATVVFCAMFATYFRRLRPNPVHIGAGISLRLSNPIGRFVWGTVVAESCILVRGVFRLAELCHGLPSPIARKQVPLLVLDAVPMLVTVIALNAIHPQFTLPQSLPLRRWMWGSSDKSPPASPQSEMRLLYDVSMSGDRY